MRKTDLGYRAINQGGGSGYCACLREIFKGPDVSTNPPLSLSNSWQSNALIARYEQRIVLGFVSPEFLICWVLTNEELFFFMHCNGDKIMAVFEKQFRLMTTRGN